MANRKRANDSKGTAKAGADPGVSPELHKEGKNRGACARVNTLRFST